MCIRFGATFVFAFVLAVAMQGSAADEKPGEWIELFDGKTLDGWKASEAVDSFSVKDGCIVAHAAGNQRSHLFYMGATEPFKDFELEADVKTEPGANSGIYFHTEFQDQGWPNRGYEAQVATSFPNEPRRTGSLYGIVDIADPPVKDNEWFKYYIKVEGKHIVIKLDAKTVVDYTEPDDPPKFQGRDRRLSEGTFALQAHPNSTATFFKNIRVRRLP
jgi:3-keto-disaccharide hydrolase